jgi:hypothetical protein
LLFAVFLGVQLVGDLVFSQVIGKMGSTNKWIKFFQDYVKSAKLSALFGDSLYILVWAITAYVVKDLPQDALFALFFFYVFILSIFAEAK